MAKYIQLALSNDPNQDTWSYYEPILINPLVFDDPLVVILQVDKSLIMNVYKVDDLPMLHPVFQKTF